MAARQTYNYTRIRRGLFDRLPAGLSRDATLFLLRLRLDAQARPIPGLLQLGEAGFAERIGWSVPATRKAIKELVGAHLLLFDQNAKHAYAVGAIEDDGPRTEQATKAFAAKYHELVTSAVKVEIARATTAVLADGPYPELRKLWGDLIRAESVTDSASESDAESGAESTSVPSPSPSPSPVPSPIPPPQPSPYARAWGRLPRPPFAAAAAEDFHKALKGIPDPETFGVLVEQLACSKWTSGQLSVPPTLRRLVDDSVYRDRILRGEFRALGARWQCPECHADHQAHADCPPQCDDCGRHHDPEIACLQRQQREHREQQEQENRARLEAVAAERGLSVEEAEEQRRAEARRALAEIRAKVARR